jgi:hypothetical protein
MRWRLVFVTAAVIAAVSCTSQPIIQDPFALPQIDWKPGIALDAAEAERILGNPSRLEKTTAYVDHGTKIYQSAFRDDWKDPGTGKTGILYYMYEEYESADAAKLFLDSTLKENHIDPNDGIRLRNGAEIHYLTGGEVTRMAMLLKENHLVRVKVNQVTSRYSLGEFRIVVSEIAGQL